MMRDTKRPDRRALLDAAKAHRIARDAYMYTHYPLAHDSDLMKAYQKTGAVLKEAALVYALGRKAACILTAQKMWTSTPVRPMPITDPNLTHALGGHT